MSLCFFAFCTTIPSSNRHFRGSFATSPPQTELLWYVRDSSSLIPVEVKAKDGATASLNNLIKWDSYPEVKYGINFGYKNIGWNGNFYTFPYFLAFLLKRFLKEK